MAEGVDVRAVAKQLASLGSPCTRDRDRQKFIKEVMTLHPTEQQSVFRLLGQFIAAMADQNHCDLRNEASVEFCQAVVKNESEKMLFPFI